jgi:hypothetical protein
VIDCDTGIQPLQEIGEDLSRAGIPSYLERSRVGGHRWIFWVPEKLPTPGQAKKILKPFSRGLELFPSGDIPDEEGYGLALRGPLGVHQVTGEYYPFVHENLERVSPGKVRGQLQWLAEHVVYVDPDRLLPAEAVPVGNQAAKQPVKRLEAAVPPDATSPIRAFNETRSIRDVVGQVVALDRNNMGRCPHGELHKENDRHKSFTIYEKSNRFWCFTCRKGGNPADFLMWAEGIDAKEFVRRYCR